MYVFFVIDYVNVVIWLLIKMNVLVKRYCVIKTSDESLFPAVITVFPHKHVAECFLRGVFLVYLHVTVVSLRTLCRCPTIGMF